MRSQGALRVRRFAAPAGDLAATRCSVVKPASVVANATITSSVSGKMTACSSMPCSGFAPAPQSRSEAAPSANRDSRQRKRRACSPCCGLVKPADGCVRVQRASTKRGDRRLLAAHSDFASVTRRRVAGRHRARRTPAAAPHRHGCRFLRGGAGADLRTCAAVADARGGAGARRGAGRRRGRLRSPPAGTVEIAFTPATLSTICHRRDRSQNGGPRPHVHAQEIRGR
jgi:hypothetical protein